MRRRIKRLGIYGKEEGRSHRKISTFWESKIRWLKERDSNPVRNFLLIIYLECAKLRTKGIYSPNLDLYQ